MELELNDLIKILEAHKELLTPEQYLVAEIITRGIIDALSEPNKKSPHYGKQREVKKEAKEWINSNSERICSFIWCSLKTGMGERTIKRIRYCINNLTPRQQRRFVRSMAYRSNYCRNVSDKNS